VKKVLMVAWKMEEAEGRANQLRIGNYLVNIVIPQEQQFIKEMEADLPRCGHH